MNSWCNTQSEINKDPYIFVILLDDPTILRCHGHEWDLNHM